MKDRGAMAIVKGCLGHIVKLVFPGRVVTLFARENASDVVGSASVQSGGRSTGTARVYFRRTKIDWTQTKDENRMMLLPTKLTGLLRWVKLSKGSRMWRTLTGDDRQGKSDRYARGCMSSAAKRSELGRVWVPVYPA